MHVDDGCVVLHRRNELAVRFEDAQQIPRGHPEAQPLGGLNAPDGKLKRSLARRHALARPTRKVAQTHSMQAVLLSASRTMLPFGSKSSSKSATRSVDVPRNGVMSRVPRRLRVASPPQTPRSGW